MGINSLKGIGAFKTSSSEYPQLRFFVLRAESGAKTEGSLKQLLKKLPGIAIADSIYVDSTNSRIAQLLMLEKDTLLLLGTGSRRNFGLLRDTYFNVTSKGIRSGTGYDRIAVAHPFEILSNTRFEKDSSICYERSFKMLNERVGNYEDAASKQYYAQTIHTVLSNFTNIEEPQQYSKSTTLPYLPTTITPTSTPYSDSAALDYLVREAASRRVVMLNESHYLRNSRMLGLLLMKRLYELGFKYMGFECIWDEKSLKEKHFPTSNTGIYSNEPMMANLIQESINSGYQVLGYDSSLPDRDTHAAQNIYQKVFAKDSTAKLLVFAGYGHISEKTGRKTLANELRRLTGFDPLTINQTDYRCCPNNWLAVIENSSIKKNIVADITVSNQLNYDKFAELLHFKTYQMSSPIKTHRSPYLISIYRADNYRMDKRAIPAYNYYSATGYTAPLFEIKLPAGEYIYVVKQECRERESGMLVPKVN